MTGEQRLGALPARGRARGRGLQVEVTKKSAASSKEACSVLENGQRYWERARSWVDETMQEEPGRGPVVHPRNVL